MGALRSKSLRKYDIETALSQIRPMLYNNFEDWRNLEISNHSAKSVACLSLRRCLSKQNGLPGDD